MIKGDKVRVTAGENRGRRGLIVEVVLSVVPGTGRYDFVITVCDFDGVSFEDLPENLLYIF